MAAGGAAPFTQVTSTAVTAEAVREWAKTARPGETLVYFSGPVLIQSLPAIAAARRLEEAGAVIFFQVRRGAGLFDYVMQKRRNAEPRTLSRAAVEEVAPGCKVDGDLEDLMAVLRRLTSLGHECPANAKLAALAGLKDAESARYRLGLLDAQGRIGIRTVLGARVITVISTGLSTASAAARD